VTSHTTDGLVPVEDHLAQILDAVAPLSPLDLTLPDAHGCVLAEDVVSHFPLPPFDNSAMDGYAVRSADLAAATDAQPVVLPVVGDIAAGSSGPYTVQPGLCVRIMTGAPVPANADRIVPVEETNGGRDQVIFLRPAAPGQHIRRQGEILKSGEPLLPAGSRLTPGALSLLATHGYGAVPVHRTPTVAVLTTGDEVVPPETAPAPGQLRDSNTDFLLAAGTTLGLRFDSLGIAPDRVDALRPLVEQGLKADVLLLCGGVSMGELDFVEGVLAELGCETAFDAVAIQPGKPLVFATHPGGWVFGLPGNPASVMVGFWLFVRPALRRLMGLPDSWWGGALTGTLSAPLPGAGPRDRFLPAEVETRDGDLLVTPFLFQGSHDLAAYARGTGLVRVRAGAKPAGAGEGCEVMMLMM